MAKRNSIAPGDSASVIDLDEHQPTLDHMVKLDYAVAAGGGKGVVEWQQEATGTEADVAGAFGRGGDEVVPSQPKSP